MRSGPWSECSPVRTCWQMRTTGSTFGPRSASSWQNVSRFPNWTFTIGDAELLLMDGGSPFTALVGEVRLVTYGWGARAGAGRLDCQLPWGGDARLVSPGLACRRGGQGCR